MRNLWRTAVIQVGIAATLIVGWSCQHPVSAQGPRVRGVMREKLRHAQGILEAVVTSNWSALETNVQQIERLTNEPRWMALKSPEYSEHSAGFVAALQELGRVATDRDSVRATDAYNSMVSRCVACHQYVARARLAR